MRASPSEGYRGSGSAAAHQPGEADYAHCTGRHAGRQVSGPLHAAPSSPSRRSFALGRRGGSVRAAGRARNGRARVGAVRWVPSTRTGVPPPRSRTGCQGAAARRCAAVGRAAGTGERNGRRRARSPRAVDPDVPWRTAGPTAGKPLRRPVPGRQGRERRGARWARPARSCPQGRSVPGATAGVRSCPPVSATPSGWSPSCVARRGACRR